MDQHQPCSMRMTALSIRLAVESERESLEALQWRAAMTNANDRESLLANPDAVMIPLSQISSGHVFVAERSERIVGFAALLPKLAYEIEIDGLFVEPDMQRLGIGRALIAQCDDFAKSQGALALFVVGNINAMDFYRSCGFAAVGIRETRFGVGLLMHKPLELMRKPSSQNS